MFRLRLAVLCVCFGSLATRNHTSTVIISRVTGNATDKILTAPSARHEDGNAAVSGDVQERVRLRSTGEPVDGSEAVPVVIRHRSSVTGEYKNETQRENIQSTNSMNTTEALSIARSSVTGEYKNETQRENIQNTNSTNTTEAVSVARMDGSSVTREYKNETHRENIQNTNSTNTTEDVSGARIHGSSVTKEYKNETQRANIQNTNSTNTTEDVSGARIDSRRNMLPAFTVYPAAVSFQTNPPTRIAPSTELVSPRIVDDFFLPYMGASSGSTKGNWVLAQKAPAQDIHWSTVRSWMSWAPESLHAWCNSYYKNRFSTVGSTYPVCGYRIDQTTLTYQFKTFDDWCKMEEENFQARSYRMYEQSHSVCMNTERLIIPPAS
ncbi:uncharacterized protein LOC133533008 isoform X1 [Cydia pomonella]|uniref:uncharacterized protein LOC133533008 isoform X1 n=1 Tax=Cydia pomonella TaxID=82600 RepID=UPI002ADE2372|nr:uncharacterized protein LOC133533008 isoform X1 [Cydia pomonella]